jgi:hypothetical protein
MDDLISKNQLALTRGWNLHNNFMLVRQLARMINTQRETCVLLKLDISRALDSFSWSFQFEILGCLGFTEIFLQWIVIAPSSASTRVLLTGPWEKDTTC